MNHKIILLQFPIARGKFSISPFCLKLETYFRVLNIPYENKFTIKTERLKKKKLPAIIDQGKLIEDSGLIIDYLKNNYQIDMDSHLTDEQKAVSKAFQWLCEKSLFDTIIHFRWCDKVNWPLFRSMLFAKAPWLIKVTIANFMALKFKKTLFLNGFGRFSEEEKLKTLDDNLSAVSNYLANKKYFFGDKISLIDIILFSFLVQFYPRGVVRQFEGILHKYPNLISFIERINKYYWSECRVD